MATKLLLLSPNPRNSGAFWIPTGQSTAEIISEKKFNKLASSIFCEGGWSVKPDTPHCNARFENSICSLAVSPYTVAKRGLRPPSRSATVSSISTRSTKVSFETSVPNPRMATPAAFEFRAVST